VKLIAEYESQVTRKEMLENPEIEDLYEEGSLGNVLTKISFDKESEDNQKPLKRRKEGRSWKYQVSDYGRQKIREWKEAEQSFAIESEDIEFGEAVKIFEEYFAENTYDKIASTIQEGQPYVKVDLMELDVFHTELYDYIRKSPETALKAAEEGLETLDLITGKVPEIRFYDVPEEDEVEISKFKHSENLGKFVSIEGLVIFNSETLPKVVSAIFECTQCGDRYQKEQDSSELKSPYKCDCGSRKFEPVEKITEDSKLLKLQGRTSSANKRKVSVSIMGELAGSQELEKTSLGSLIKVNGIVKQRPLKKDSKKLDVYLEANSIKFKDKNRLEEIEEETKDRVRELSKDPEIKEKLKQTVAKGAVGGLDRVKEAYLVFRLGKTEDGNIHLFIAGEPGVGKSLLGEESSEILPRTIYTVLKGTTEKGLTVSFDTEDGEEQDYRAGDLVECDDGFFIGDEAGNFKGDYNVFNTPMEQEIVNRSANGRKVSLPASVSVFLISNPVKTEDGRQWNEDNPPSIEQLPLSEDTDTLSRFDIQLAIPKQKIAGSKSAHRELEKAEKVLQSSESVETEIDVEVYKAYLSMAEDIEPELTAESQELLIKISLGLSLKNYTASPRVLKSLKKMSKAYARIRLEEKVSRERVFEAYIFWKGCRGTLYDEYRVEDSEDKKITEENGFETLEVVKL